MDATYYCHCMDDTTLSLNQRVALNVRRLRVAAGLAQDELAAAANVDRTYVSQIELGKRNITLDSLERIAVALHVDPAALLRVPKSAEPSPNLQRKPWARKRPS